MQSTCVWTGVPPLIGSSIWSGVAPDTDSAVQLCLILANVRHPTISEIQVLFATTECGASIGAWRDGRPEGADIRLQVCRFASRDGDQELKRRTRDSHVVITGASSAPTDAQRAGLILCRLGLGRRARQTARCPWGVGVRMPKEYRVHW